MGVCLPKAGQGDKNASAEPGSPKSGDKPAFEAEPGSPKSKGMGGEAPLDITSPAPPDQVGHGAHPGGPAHPVQRKRSLQMEPQDMAKLLTQFQPGSPMSPKRSPAASPTAAGPALLPPPSRDTMGKRCLVIDLDETLVHTERQPSGFPGGKYDFKISVRVGASTFPMYVSKRPGCDDFLRRASENYELIIFTASVEAYCSAVMEKIDPHGYVSHCLDRRHCTFYQNEIYVKDLSRLGRVLRDCILLDNNADCYLFQPENAIPINSWYDDKTDTDLEDVLGILEVITQNKKSAVATLEEIDDKLGWGRKNF